MKKTKILTIAGVMLAMALTGCKSGDKTSESKAPESSGNPTSQPTSQPTSNPSTNPSTSGGGQSTSTTPAPQIHIHDLEGSEKVDVLEEEGAVAEEMYKCKDCDKYAVAWSALDYDVTKTTERSTSKPESRASGKAIRFSSTANYQDADVTKKGCHIVYNVYLPEAVENANLLVKMAKRTDTNDVFARYEDDQAKGYEYVPQASGDPVLERPATRYGIKLDGNVYIIPEDNTNQSWKDNTGWYQFPGQLPALTAGAHEVEIYNLGGFRTDMYNFALVGFGPHEHVTNYKVTETKVNEDGKPVSLGVDSFTGEKAAMVEMKDISGAYASSKTSAEGEPEAFGLGDQDTAFKAANTYKLDKGKVIAFKVNLSAEVKGAKIEVGAEFKNAERYFYNMKIRGNETMTDNNADKDTEDAWRYYVKVNEGAFQPMGCEDKMQDVLGETAGKYMPLGTFDLKAGANMIYIRQGNIGYRVTFDNPLRVIFKGDATITGETYVPPHEHNWVAGTKTGVLTPYTCECGAKYYALDFADTDPKVDAQKLKTDAIWNVTGLPAGKYDVELYACAAATTLTQQIMADATTGRYQFRFGADAAYVNPTAGTYASFGLGTGEDAAHCKWTSPLCQLTAAEGVAHFEIHWTNKGYSAFIGGVRLVAVAE